MAFHYPARVNLSGNLPPEIIKAVDIQKYLAAKVRIEDDFGDDLKTIAGIDVGYDLKLELTKAVVVLLSYPGLELQTSVIAYEKTDFPYISGFLAFREVPAILKALDCLPQKPDLLMVDGQGIAHPRRLGIAAHLGALTDLPAIGVAKSRLCGKHETLPNIKLEKTFLMDRGEMIGTVLQSKEKCNPLYVSAGHRISQQTALDITLHCLKGYRLPEPTRIADQISKWKLGTDKNQTKPNIKNPPPMTGDLFGSKDV